MFYILEQVARLDYIEGRYYLNILSAKKKVLEFDYDTDYIHLIQ